MLAPNFILPIMVLNLLGAEQTAYYYISFAIATLLIMIPNSVGTSLFVEGSYGEALKKTTLKSLLAIFALLTPAIIILYIAGGWLLGLISQDYAANGFELLRIMVLASIFVAVIFIYYSIKRVQKDIKGLVFLSGLVFVLLMTFSYPLIFKFGITGVGYAWIASYGIAAIFVGLIIEREGWI